MGKYEKPWENNEKHEKIMENHGKTMKKHQKTMKNDGKTIKQNMGIGSKTIYIANWKSTMFNSYVKSPEGTIDLWEGL